MQQQVAPLDCLAHLAGPPAKANRGAAALFGGQLLAYAASSAVVVVDVSGTHGWLAEHSITTHRPAAMPLDIVLPCSSLAARRLP